MKKIYSILIILLSLNICPVNAQQIAPFEEGERVVFLGNSITDGGHYHSYIWLYYMTRYPNMKFTVLNAGVGGDKASDMYERLDGDVFSKNPTVLVTTFGMNDTGYFEYNGSEPQSFADQKVKESHEAYILMEKRFKSLPNTNIVIVGSTPYNETAKIEGNTAFKNKNKAMLRIVDFQQKSAEKNGWQFFDFNSSMTALNEKHQQLDPTFTLCGNDRIHPDNDGHMVMAYLFLKAQGMSGKEVAAVDIDASKNNVISSSNCTISALRKTSTGLAFDYLAEALPYPMDTTARGWGSKNSQAKAVEVVPFMEEMNKETIKITGLKGKHRLMIDEEEIGVWTADDYAKGLNLAALSNTPQYQQALRIMHLNEERWEIERRFRDYAWIQFGFFQSKGLLFANNRKAIDILDQHVEKDGWLKAKRDLYAKAMYPEVRQAWQDEMDMLVSTIYNINTPVKRKITLIKN